MIKPVLKRITNNSTSTVVPATCLLSQVVISCGVAGSAWTLQIQDKASTPFILIPAFTLALPVDGYPNVNLFFEQPLPMDGGIDIITAAGSGTREVAVYLIINDGQ